MNNHLTPEQLIGYIHLTLTDAEREELDQHLALCPPCRALLSEHEIIQRRIRYGLSAGLKKVQPSHKMSFAAIAPHLKRKRGWSFFLNAIDQPLSSAVALGVLVLLGLALFVVLGRSAPLPPPVVGRPTPEPVTIVFAHHPHETQYYAELSKTFNKIYPHITIEQFTRPYQTQDGHLVAEGPDVILDWQYNVATLQTHGELLDLTPYLDEDKLYKAYDFYLAAANSLTDNERTWAIPISVEPMVMYYNKDLFDQHDLSYPKTGWSWRNFENIANTINDPQVQVAGYVPLGHEENYLDLFIFIHQKGGKVYRGTPMASRPSFVDPLTLEAVEWYANLMPHYEVGQEGQLQQNYTGYGPQVFRGALVNNAGMWMGPPSLGLRYGADNWSMRWGVAPLPRQAKPATAGWLDVAAITTHTKNSEAAWKWINFLSLQLPYQKVPVRTSLLKSGAYEQMVGSDMAAITREAILYTDLLSPELTVQDKAMSHFFINAIDDIMAGRNTPRRAMQQAQQGAEDILAADQ